MSSPAGMRRLAVAVLQRAAYDAAGLVYNDGGAGVLPATRRARARAIMAEAYAWLSTPSESLDIWSEMAGIAMKDVVDGADSAVEYALRELKADRRRRGMEGP